MSTSPTTTDLQAQVNALAVRMAVIDGQGLVAPATGYVVQTTNKIAGLQTDLTQSVLTIESLLNKVTASVQALWTALSTYLGISPPPSTGPIPPP